jgi:predicted dienelactone hydrolase
MNPFPRSSLSASLGRTLSGAALLFTAALAQAAIGLVEIPPSGQDGSVTIFYPTDADARPVPRGQFTLPLAVDAAPRKGNGRLVVISHGSGGSPWVHSDLARALVEAGFVVALPQHRADNYRDDSDPGPDSWTIRPGEVSRAIDTVGHDSRFAPLLRLDRVGVYGMSAGGHTALSLAGGRWSPARFANHCHEHLVEDFPACVGLITRLTGGPLDAVRKWAALAVIDHRFGADVRSRSDDDPRVAAVVAAVPAAADFDPGSLAQPRVPLGIVTARQDRWLQPRFHGDRILAACQTCEHIADLAEGGHGALLSPFPPKLTGAASYLLQDPPGFDRAVLPAIDKSIASFFSRHLLAEGRSADFAALSGR